MYYILKLSITFLLFFVILSSTTVIDHILSDNYIISSGFGSTSLPTLNTNNTYLGVYIETVTNGTVILSQLAPHFLNGITTSLKTENNGNITAFTFEYQSGSTGKIIEANVKVTVVGDTVTEINRADTKTVYSGTLMTMSGSGFYPGSNMAQYKLTDLEISFQYVYANSTSPDDIELSRLVGGWKPYVEPALINLAGNELAGSLFNILSRRYI